MPLLDDHLCKHISQKKHRLLKKRSHWLAGINLIFQIILRADRNPYHKIRNVFHLTVWIGTDMNDGAVHRCSGFSSDPQREKRTAGADDQKIVFFDSRFVDLAYTVCPDPIIQNIFQFT